MIATIIHDFQKNLISKKAYFNCLLHLPHKNNKGPTTINEQLITLLRHNLHFFLCVKLILNIHVLMKIIGLSTELQQNLKKTPNILRAYRRFPHYTNLPTLIEHGMSWTRTKALSYSDKLGAFCTRKVKQCNIEWSRADTLNSKKQNNTKFSKYDKIRFTKATA